MAMTLQDLLNTAEVAERLGVSPELVRYWRHAGQGPPGRRIGHVWIYCADDVDAWAREQGRSNGQTAQGGPE
jgi:DNA-binding transcriptional MerR regulator